MSEMLEIIGRALNARGIDQLAAWLITPGMPDGKTPAELLAAGEFDRARMVAVCTTASEDARRRAGRPATGQGSGDARTD